MSTKELFREALDTGATKTEIERQDDWNYQLH